MKSCLFVSGQRVRCLVTRTLSLCLALCFSASSLCADPPAENATTQDVPATIGGTARQVSFLTDVLPIVRTKCFGCHQGARKLGEYQMNDFAEMLRGGESGEPAIVPGDANASYLIDQIVSEDGVAAMPKTPQKPLHKSEVELIRRWIDQGAVNDSGEAPGLAVSPDHPPQYVGPPTIPSIDLSPDGTTLAAAGYHEVVLVDAESGEIRDRLIGISPRINSVAFSPDGTRLAATGGTPGEHGDLQIWDVESGQLTLSKMMTHDTITGVSWSPDGKLVAFGANDNVVRAIDSSSGEQVLYQGAHEDWIRGTSFTADGKHLISVARDMTCKLTEVATQRFVDNITSITPGALSGGLSSVVTHPTRDEIVVGGSDGIAKLYRVFRQTERKIGDDANLIRRLPAMDGRIRDVAIDANGRYIAAGATINGHSEVRVWEYDSETGLTAEQKAILAKRVADRSADENKKIEAARSKPTPQTLHYKIPDAAAYSVDVDDDGGVWVAANDGLVRYITPEGILEKSYPIADWEHSGSDSVATFNSDVWVKESNGRVRLESDASDPVSTASLVSDAQVVELKVTPTAIELASPYEYVQLVAMATMQDGSTLDVTDQVEIHPHDSLAIQTGGLIRPRGNAAGEVSVQFGRHVVKIPFKSTGQTEFDVDFIRDVNPVLSRLGCNQGTCHGAQKGKNGFRLSLRGYDPIFDIRALTDDLAARRINPAAPEDSMMLRKPLGLTPHEGGTLMSSGDPYHAVLRQWIAAGSQLRLETPRVASIELFPSNPVVQSINARQQVRVVATYTDGSSRDVTREAFIESGNSEVATPRAGGVLHAVRRGEAPVLARFEGAYAATTLTVMGDRTGYEQPDVPSWNRIDELVAQKWERMKIVPSDIADDATFLRRVHLDLTGLPPSSDAVRAFLADPTPVQEKRAKVVDQLIGNDDFVVYWTNKWADLLQVNRKFLGVEGSKTYRQWIRDAIAENRPYDEFARQILTATGSNQSNPPASYYKVLRTPEETMENTTHLFLGIRFNCNKCHDHPFERWTQDQYYEMAAFFAHVGRKRDPASGDRKVGGSAVEKATPLFEMIDDSSDAEVMHARTGDAVAPKFPFDLRSDTPPTTDDDVANRDSVDAANLNAVPAETLTAVRKADDVKLPSRRERLAEWMTSPNNAYFARSYVNRVWAYLTGVGLIEPIDDIRAGNPPTNPELLDYLTDEFVRSGFDCRALIRLICHSRTYGLSVETHPLNADDHQNYSHATPRRLPAEVIYDAVHQLTGATSNLPGMPAGSRAAEATDAGIALPDGFLASLGRPVRETACECERSDDLQLGPVMALISGPTIGAAISDPKNEIEKIVSENATDEAVAEEIFLRAIGRVPTVAELDAFISMTAQIQTDHQHLVERLARAEADWKDEFTRREAVRTSALAELETQVASREAEIADHQAALRQKRETAIQQAEARLAEVTARIPEAVKTWVAKTRDSAHPEWFPLMPISASSTGKVVLRVQPDRSVLASGKAAKATYTLDFETSLNHITGFRVEAIADAALPGGGPGLPENGNFVVTEIAVQAGSNSTTDPKKLAAVRIASGQADFLQSGFTIKPVFDGRVGNQNGWAAAPNLGRDHWATFQFVKPIDVPEGSDNGKTKTRLRFTISQNHKAANHLLGRFRISVTTHDGDIPLGITESLATAAATPADHRTDEQTKLLTDYVSGNDAALQKANAAVVEAKMPVPADEKLSALLARKKKLEPVTPTDPDLETLRANVQRSHTQRENYRVTAAEDLVWALINTPAFLFNH
ncbi:DUF1549 domain-containing protein [Aporhodopirellula aestuarii]|uniref:DUF1549 domain-containing protein n=1 Tax=Aporhodopirellula aestuarii TaxID=2950107 RepID=A0ABT0U4J9_9BACT|nr:DUF1549 domain-containing protein [Aporhodopirellula aestuarii]MCM2371851.1 DUF1549 domain-containing protein [Aporhodopirellula aestuarii]